jgi:methionyl-tRNA formyltransferase
VHPPFSLRLTSPAVVEKWAIDYNIPYISVVKGQWDTLQPFLRQSNLIVAVSFGLFIPAPTLRRISTVNVHPSILPQYRGPCPIHHALINNDHHTGVTLQTLSPKGFDMGIIFKQSPLIAIKDTDRLPDLWTRLADTGAEMLLDCIQARTYLHPTPIPSETQPSYAGFISTQIDWESTSPRTAISKSRVFDLETGAILLDTGRRTPIHIRGLSHRQQGPGSKNPGDFFVAREPVSGEKKMVVVCLGGTVFVEEVKVSGRPWINGVQFVGTAEGRFWGGRFVPKRTEFEELDRSELGYE